MRRPACSGEGPMSGGAHDRAHHRLSLDRTAQSRDRATRGARSARSPRRSDPRSRPAGSPRPHGTRRRTATGRTARPVGLRPELHEDDRDARDASAARTSCVVIWRRVAGDDADEHLGAIDDVGTPPTTTAPGPRRRAESSFASCSASMPLTTIGPTELGRASSRSGVSDAARLRRTKRANARGAHDDSRPRRARRARGCSGGRRSAPGSSTIDEPPTVTNGSGMPVTGATPIVMPTFTNTWKRKPTTSPPATTTP